MSDRQAVQTKRNLLFTLLIWVGMGIWASILFTSQVQSGDPAGTAAIVAAVSFSLSIVFLYVALNIRTDRAFRPSKKRVALYISLVVSTAAALFIGFLVLAGGRLF